MKRTLIFLLLTTLLLGLAGCRFNYMEPEAMEQFLDGIAENIGDSQITNDENLIGERTLVNSEDSYAGEYFAECNHMTGRDVVFGGASIYNKELFISGNIQTEVGTAKIRIRLNDEVTELESDIDGNFETTLKLSNGGNYMMVVYEDFTGSIEMSCEYVPQDDIYAE